MGRNIKQALRWSVLAVLALTGCSVAGGESVNIGHPGSVGTVPAHFGGDWKTDFSRHAVPFDEIVSGGPGKDGIPAIDQPKFQPASTEAPWLKDVEPVIALRVGNDVRAYPIQVLIWHEIVNDTVGGVPVVATFCPLCNTAIAFERRMDGQTLDFGTTGNLRHSDLVMYDRQTESWWQQITGEAIVGTLTGKKLTMVPASIVSWKEFKDTFPQGRVMTRDTGFRRAYGQNPYVGYDDVKASPFLYRGPADGRLPPMERVVTVSVDGKDIAFPFSVLARRRAVHHDAGGKPLVVFWAPGTASALDRETIAGSRDVGSSGVFVALLDGRRLTFEAHHDGTFVDTETGTSWNVLGRATAGPLAGRDLDAVLHANHFWFAWAVFKPGTVVYSERG